MTRHDERSDRRGYHHGNLREALIQAARELMAEHGAVGVTLSEAARMAGVSPAAPYRHFKDRNTLMIALAVEGFTSFADTLEKAWDNGAGGSLTSLLRIGNAYVGFVRRQPASYTAMFESGIDHGSDPELSRQSNRAFWVIRDAAAAMHASLPEDRRAPPLMIALHVWTMAHGISSLFLRGDTARRNLPVSPEELLESGILIYLHGLGLDQKH